MSVRMYGFVLELCLLSTLIGNFPVPLMGYGNSLILGYFYIYNLVYKGKDWFIDLRKEA